jgi:DNA-binding SARP family transcriptional activator
MRFGILGPLAVWDGRCWVGVPAAKERVLLAVLLLKAGQLVTADWLIEQLWAQRPPVGVTNQLQVYVSRLRRRLDDRPGRVLITQSRGYRLVMGAGELDLQRFEELVATGRRALQEGMLERAAGSFGDALGLWRGRALADVPPSQLVDDETMRLEEHRLLAVEDLIDVELRRARHGGLVGQLQTLVAQQPLRERLWGQLLVALCRSGRQAEALAAYQQLRGRLVGELGIEPCAELQRLHRLILTADPALQLEPQAAPRPGGAAAGLVTLRQLPPDVAQGIGSSRRIATPRPSRYLDGMEQAADPEMATLAAATSSRDPEIGLRAVAALRGLLEVLEALQVDNARAHGWSWQQIASRLGVTKQAVHQKHSRRSSPGQGR